jgi:hypothetical protein
MGNILNEDFLDFLKLFNQFHVEYILVGGYAVIFHGYNRTTGDLDVWVQPTLNNYRKMMCAFKEFGLSPFNMTEDLFLNSNENDVFTFGRPPVSIDILTKVKGLDFDNAFTNSSMVIFDGVEVNMIDLRDLKKAKRAAGRPKDMDDLEHL